MSVVYVGKSGGGYIIRSNHTHSWLCNNYHLSSRHSASTRPILGLHDASASTGSILGLHDAPTSTGPILGLNDAPSSRLKVGQTQTGTPCTGR